MTSITKHRGSRAALLLGCVLISPALFPEGAKTFAKERALIERIDRAMSPESYTSTMAMENRTGPDKATVTENVAYRSGPRMLVLVRKPSIQRGQALLRDGDDMWLYLPASRKLSRVGSKEKSFGSEASNADLIRTDFAADYDIVGSSMEAEVSSPLLCIELKARRKSVAYDRVLYWIDEGAERPQKREYYALSGKLLKTMTFSDFAERDGRIVPTTIRIVNELNPSRETTIRILSMDSKTPVSENRFNAAWLESGATTEE